MRVNSFILCVLSTCLLCSSTVLAQSVPAGPERQVIVPIVQNGQPACTIITTGSTDGWLFRNAIRSIQDTAQRWTGVVIPTQSANELSNRLPQEPSIVISTLEDLRSRLPKLATASPLIDQVAFLDEQGFVITPQALNNIPCVLIVGRTPRAAYNGAIWLRDFCIDGTKDNLQISCKDTIRNPHLPGRVVYNLTIWGHEAEYTVADWEKIFDSYARDGFDRVYFWVSGHFPSKKFPQAVKCRDDKWDTAEKSKIATVKDLQHLIRAAHDRGLKFYAGGALGGWCCTYNLTNLAPGTMKTPKDKPYEEPSSLCPSHPAARQALLEYFDEIFDGLPEADGLFIESADEWGNCYCPLCDKKIDNLGSRQFGQSQISLIQQIMQTVWRKHPHARLAYTIGYAEHSNDPAYYESIRNMSDPRLEWMEARDSWTFPAITGKNYPSSYFSRQVMRWAQYYNHPLQKIIDDTARVSESGMYGCITAFEPGFATGSLHESIPHPMHLMPYVLTGFVWREATWSPSLTAQTMQERIQQRFFGREAPSTLGKDLWDLRDLILDCSHLNKEKNRTRVMTETLNRIEENVQRAKPTAGPKTAETLGLMAQAIADIRTNTN